MICKSCGGVIGRDCFNQEECAAITRDMAMRMPTFGKDLELLGKDGVVLGQRAEAWKQLALDAREQCRIIAGLFLEACNYLDCHGVEAEFVCKCETTIEAFDVTIPDCIKGELQS